jgi:hypothetical protein
MAAPYAAMTSPSEESVPLGLDVSVQRVARQVVLSEVSTSFGEHY